METTFIQNKMLVQMGYPVGHHVKENTEIIKIMVQEFMAIDEFKDKYVNIFCQGSSGAMVAFVFAMNIPNSNRIIHIKKDGENSHNTNMYVHPNERNAINIIVDDLISSGATINRIYDKAIAENGKLNIDLIAVSGLSFHQNIKFQPKYFICYSQ